MSTTITGTYKDGQIILDKELPAKSDNAKVIVTLVEETSKNKPKREFGRLKDAFTDPYCSSKEF